MAAGISCPRSGLGSGEVPGAWGCIWEPILKKQSYSGSMSESACVCWLRTSSSPRYQPFNRNPEQTADWQLAASNRFFDTFDHFALYQEDVCRGSA